MYHIKTFNKISPAGLAVFQPPDFIVDEAVEQPDGILLRSYDLREYTFPSNLRAIARAGAGVNNIPVDRCSEAGIVVFNTPGANANAVKELAICALFLSSRNIVGGSAWVKEQCSVCPDISETVEKGKTAFTGPEVEGKTLGVIGLGAIGVKVANAATKLGMTVYGYDPYLSVDAALSLSRSVHRALDPETIYRNCDYITLHVPLSSDTREMLNKKAFSLMKTGTRIINLARGELVCDDDIIEALDCGKVACYVTDFPNNKIVAAPNVVPIPHLGASTPESEENCAIMAAEQLRNYLLFGNIKNSVNLPNVEMEQTGTTRVCVIHRNIPNMLASITNLLSSENINVENLMNRSKKEYAYTMLDLNCPLPDRIKDQIRGINGVLRVRII
jgi:D-3-phosphoglycerate dehydrogenase